MSDAQKTALAADLGNLRDPYRSMAFWARDLADELANAGHQEQAADAAALLQWLVKQGEPY